MGCFHLRPMKLLLNGLNGLMDQIIIKHLYFAINGNLATHGIKLCFLIWKWQIFLQVITIYYQLVHIHLSYLAKKITGFCMSSIQRFFPAWIWPLALKSELDQCQHHAWHLHVPWITKCCSQLVYETLPWKEAINILPASSVLGRLPVVLACDTGTIQ